jgi:hypothetical protein
MLDLMDIQHHDMGSETWIMMPLSLNLIGSDVDKLLLHLISYGFDCFGMLKVRKTWVLV